MAILLLFIGVLLLLVTYVPAVLTSLVRLFYGQPGPVDRGPAIAARAATRGRSLPRSA